LSNNIKSTGDGTRPMTDGTVDNIGAGEKLDAGRSAPGEANSGPAPTERMANKKANAEGTKHDDSAAFELTEDLDPETNKESAPRASKH
jgi:hypothetical protein